MDELEIHKYQSALEALLFVSDKPVTLDQFKAVFLELKPSEIQELLGKLEDEYVQRDAGMMVVQIAGGWQMLSNSRAATYIREFYKTKSKEKLSRPALETLAIIAYKQPTGRADIEVVRGVNSDGTVAHLLNKGLIRIVGRKEVPGRPFLYGTTKEFLEYFGLKSLEDMPKIEEFTQLGVENPQEGPAAQEEAPAQAREPVAELDQAIDRMQEEAATRESSGQSRMTGDHENMEQDVILSPDETVGRSLPAGRQES